MSDNTIEKPVYVTNISTKINEITDKGTNVSNQILYMLNRTNEMFKWGNIPDTIPQRMLELMIQTEGNGFVTNKHDGKNLYIYRGGLGGQYDEYYQPTEYIVNNPYQKFNKTLKIGVDGVLIRNDALMQGLLPMFKKKASMICENEISIHVADINSRIVNLLSASTGKEKDALDKYIKDIYDGKISSVMDRGFMEENIKLMTSASTTQNGQITQLIELQQYLQASWYIELGVNANWNSKRESISSGESDLNDDVLRTLVDNMLKCRQDACKEINTMYGTDWTCELNGVWAENAKQRDIENKKMENEAGLINEETKENDNEVESENEESGENNAGEETEKPLDEVATSKEE
jgi:hypothetical protein